MGQRKYIHTCTHILHLLLRSKYPIHRMISEDCDDTISTPFAASKTTTEGRYLFVLGKSKAPTCGPLAVTGVLTTCCSYKNPISSRPLRSSVSARWRSRGSSRGLRGNESECHAAVQCQFCFVWLDRCKISPRCTLIPIAPPGTETHPPRVPLLNDCCAVCSTLLYALDNGVCMVRRGYRDISTSTGISSTA